MATVIDRQDGLRECTRFRLFDGYVTAQPIEKHAEPDGIREVVLGQESMAGKILPLIVGFAAHLWVGNGFHKLGSFENEQDAFDAVIDRFVFDRSEKPVHRRA